MGATLQDLQPKPFKVTVQGIELDCQPLRLSHALIVAKIGSVFDPNTKASKQEIQQAEADMQEIIGELIPELKTVQLGVADILDVIAQMMETIQPTDNKELVEKGVNFNDDPKEETIG